MRQLPAALAVLAVLCQIAYPLTDAGSLQSRLTVTTVVVFCAAVVGDALVRRGVRWAVTYTVIALAVGLLAEAVGVHTGFPFGSYAYADTLGPKLAGVPLVIPLAWTMFAYPALLAGRRVGETRVEQVGLAALALASWDLFLDPQMVEAGHWSWRHPEPGLPGIPGIPLTNFAGWLLVSVLLMTVLDRVLPAARASEAVPGGLLLWTWVGSTLAAAAFFGRPWVALLGGLAMGVTAYPYARGLVRELR